jgi:crotonobetaine/carnitine-CoA ligase
MFVSFRSRGTVLTELIEDPVLPRLLIDQAAAFGDKLFLRQVNGRQLSYSDCAEETRRRAWALRQLGVQRGDHVAVLLPNGMDAVLSWLAIGYANAVEVPIHVEYRRRLLTHALNTCRSRVLITCMSLLPHVLEVSDELDHLVDIVVLDADPEPHQQFHLVGQRDFSAVGDEVEVQCEVSARDLGTIMFTSGTTGPSKGVMVSWAQLLATTEGCWPATYMRANDVYYCPLPSYHISGKIAVHSMLRSGGTVVLRERYSTSAFWTDVAATRSTCACVMGAMAEFLAAQPHTASDASTPLDRVLMLPLPANVPEFCDRFRLRIRTIFNQSETSCPITSDGFELPAEGSCGTVRNGYECRVVDSDDNPLPVGAVGELLVRAQVPWTQMTGYLAMPEKTLEATRNQWLHTGDAFRVDEHGNYFFVDRIKDVIRRRGENVSSHEVESFVLTHRDVSECAAVAVQSRWTEDEIKVVVVRRPRSTLSEGELYHFLAAAMPKFMRPRYIQFMDTLPKTETQKIRKAVLRDLCRDTVWDAEATANPRHRASDPRNLVAD